MDASAKNTLASLNEKCLEKGSLHSTEEQQAPPVKVSSGTPKTEPSDEELGNCLVDNTTSLKRPTSGT